MSNRWPGGLIRKTPVTPAGPFQNGAAPGMWSLADAAYWTKQGLWPIAGNEQLVVEDVFSTYLYTGNGSTRTITNGIDLAGKGGLVWIKCRSLAGENNVLLSQVSGSGSHYYWTFSDLTGGSSSLNSSDTYFLQQATGFRVGPDPFSQINGNGQTFASWTFREAPKFFDVVTYTGDGTSGRTIAHNLGVAPGCVMIKRTDSTGDWTTWHRSLSGSYPSSQNYLFLNSTGAQTTAAQPFTAAPSSTALTVSASVSANSNGATYVAYLFAHDTASDGIIQCGSYTGSGNSNPVTVNLGWEPQWILSKRSDGVTDWQLWDIMRGMNQTQANLLVPNTSDAEGTPYAGQAQPYGLVPTATGFTVATTNNPNTYFNTGNIIYIAIRRGPMKTPTLGTSVFSPVRQASAGTVTTNFPVDLAISTGAPSGSGASRYALDRLRGSSTSSNVYLTTDTTAAEVASSGYGFGFANNTGYLDNFWSGSTVAYWNFRRAPGFFDEVCYTGTGAAGTITHNLGVAPELVITKGRGGVTNWGVYHAALGPTKALLLNGTNSEITSANYWNNTAPTATQVSLGATTNSSTTFVAYLFASCPGVSKVGSYTGTGALQTINCAFTTGARFVLIKRTDSTGDWYVWDSANGISSGNDPYILLNNTDGQVTGTNYVDTDTTGFKVTAAAPAGINAVGGTYIFLAIA